MQSLSSFFPFGRQSAQSRGMQEKAPMLQECDFDESRDRIPRRPGCLQRALPWLPHIILVITYGGILASWPMFRPAYNQEILKKPDLPWIARAEGTFLEIGDFFNISETVSPSPGAEAAWEALQKHKLHDIARKDANTIRIHRAYVESPTQGDGQILSKLHRLHCLHVLWRRWHNQTTEEEASVSITSEPHDNHCFAVIRYWLMCGGELHIKKVGWEGTHALRSGTIDVEKYCSDPEKDGTEVEVTGNGSN